MNLPPLSDADRCCRTRYRELRRLARRRGPDQADIQRFASNYIDWHNDNHWVTPEAYVPTGLALGCPLPDAAFIQRLLRLARCVGSFLEERYPNRGSALAYVPPRSYHVTLVNRSHFDTHTRITPLTPKELDKTRTIMSTGRFGPLDMHFEGLILTTGGRLIVPGFPCGDLLYTLRLTLAEQIPTLRVNLPNTAHIKLAHLCWAPGTADWGELLDWVARCGEHVSARLQFTNAYSPFTMLPLS